MKFVNKNLDKLALTLVMFFLPAVSFAQNQSTVQLYNPIPDVKSIPDFIQKILVGAMQIGIPIIALAIIYSGFLFVAARGNAEKLTKAKDALLYSIIGAAILLGSVAIANLIVATVGKL